MSFALTIPRPLAHLPTASDAMRLFTPNWFAANMGTGILALLLGQFDSLPLLHGGGFVLWAANSVVFSLFALLFAGRWLWHFDGARRMLGHPVMSMSLGCIPMALATIANGFLIFGIDVFGPVAIGIVQVLWWLEIALAVGCGLAVPVLMMTRHDHRAEEMTGVWLLPIVAAEVAAVTGALLLPHLPAADQPGVLLISFILWSFSVPPALGLVALLFIRMILHKLPQANMAASCWLALGPIATGALGLLLLGEAAPAALIGTNLAPFADVIAGACLLLSVLLWGYGVWWMGLAALITARYFTNHVPFNLGWWAYVFPLGVQTLTTFRLARIWDSFALGAFGVSLAVALILIWTVVASRTIAGAWRGTLFAAPCLTDR
jgi:C4-dicarboxylate transporter/malic acid transport protein